MTFSSLRKGHRQVDVKKAVTSHHTPKCFVCKMRLMDKITFPSELATRESLLQLTRAFADQPGTCLLLSGGDLDSAENSYLTLFPLEQVVVSEEEDPWGRLQERIQIQGGSSLPLWIGYLAYEMGATSDSSVRLSYPKGREPDAYFQRSALLFHLNHKQGTLTLHLAPEVPQDSIWRQLDFWRQCLKEKKEDVYTSQTVDPFPSYEEYRQKLALLRERIYEGDLYQANFSHQTRIASDMHPFELFDELVKRSPTPFSAYCHFPEAIFISASPERLLSCKEGVLETRPIKGTAARGKTPKADRKAREELVSSIKDRAELLMIIDLMRNDLAQISEVGSVVVKEQMRLETYATVFHLVSVIQSKLLPGLHPLAAVKACFPGGSITGCPKLRSMEALLELEGRRRGIYTGSIGYLAGDGSFDFNIAIRTLYYYNKIFTLQLGGGIIADSDPVSEYQETLQKGKTILELLGGNDDSIPSCECDPIHGFAL